MNAQMPEERCDAGENSALGDLSEVEPLREELARLRQELAAQKEKELDTTFSKQSEESEVRQLKEQGR